MMKRFCVAWGAVACGVAVFSGFVPATIGLAHGASSQPAQRKGEAAIAPPAALAERGIEGWARVCHTVRSDGGVGDIRVLDASPRPEFARAAREAVATWTYQPARLEDDAVDEHDVCELVVFRVPATETAAQESTRTQLDEAEGLIEAIDPGDPEADTSQPNQDLAAALEILDGLAKQGPLSLDQGARSQLLRYRIAVREKKEEAALVALERATVGGGRFIVGEDLVPALGAQFTGLAQQGRYQEALLLFDRFETLDGGALPMVVHGKAASSIRELAASANSFAVPAKLSPKPDGSGGLWRYRPLRRELGLRELEGTVKALAVECDRRKIRLDYQEDVSWGIPESWGDCTVYAEGDVGTTFELVEFAPAAVEKKTGSDESPAPAPGSADSTAPASAPAQPPAATAPQ